MTRNRTSFIAKMATDIHRKSVVAGIALAKTAWPVPAWAWTPPTTITPASQLLITNVSNQMLSLYHNEGKGLSLTRLRAPKSAALPCSLLASAVFSSTYDLDGWPDVLVPTAISDADIQRVQAK